MIRSLLHLSGNAGNQPRRRHVRRPLELQTLEERKMMTVAACVLPYEPAAIVVHSGANLAGANPAGGNQAAEQATDQPGGVNANPIPQVEGTTVQLPTVAITSVTTTVSVPDGGTVLLGGIKSSSEGPVEPAVPMLNKIPYISRLFKNVAEGREPNSLMLMVTPRIIIQEEE